MISSITVFFSDGMVEIPLDIKALIYTIEVYNIILIFLLGINQNDFKLK